MNEREAIEFIMQEIKEQRRADHEMYLDMRKQTTSTYDRFLDRLRELDEREAVHVAPALVIPKTPTLTSAEPSESKKAELKEIMHNLPRHALHTVEEMRVDKYDLEEEETRKQAKMDDVLPLVREYLKNADGSEPIRDIQYYVETELNHTWNNFSQVMIEMMKLDTRIQRSKVRGYFIYKEE
jgi:hypothetical protein